MEQKHRTILRLHWSSIRDNLEPKDILPKLVTVLIETDKEDIKAQSTRQGRCDRLLEILLRRGPTAFGVFVEALKQTVPHLAVDLTEADKKTEDELIDPRKQSARLIAGICKLKTELETEKQNRIRTLQGLKKMKTLHGKGNETKEEEITPDGLQKKEATTESLTQKEQDETRQKENLKEDDERLLQKRDYLDEENKQEKQSENLEAAKEEQEKIKQLQRENKQLKEKVTEKTFGFEKILAREQQMKKKLKDSLEKCQAQTKDKDVLLEKMRLENKRLHEQSNAEKSKCDALSEEVRRLKEISGRNLVSSYYEMEDMHRDILDACRISLRKDLEHKKLLPHLVSKKILDITDEQEIKGKDTREESCDVLLEMLPRRGPNAFHQFVEALRIAQPHLADLLEEKEEPYKPKKPLEDPQVVDLGKQCSPSFQDRATSPLERKELECKDESCSRCKRLRNERDSARRENLDLYRKINHLKNTFTEESENHQGEYQALQNKLKGVESEQEKLQKLNEDLEAEKKRQEQMIRNVTSDNNDLRKKANKEKSEFDKMLAREQMKNKKLKDKFQAEIDAKDVELQKMREENKRLHEESNAEKLKCDDHPREEVGRLLQMPWPGRVHNYEKDFDTNGVVYALIRNPGSPNSTQTSITATRSSDGQGEATDILEHRVEREIVSGTKAEQKSWWCVDLTENYALYLTHYTLRNGVKMNRSHLLNWQLQGSHDGQSWETLRTHDNDRGLKGNGSYDTCTWAIGGKNPAEIVGDTRWKKAFRYFRIFQTGVTSSGTFGIFLSGIELYGVLVKIGR